MIVRLLQLYTLKIFTFAPLVPNLPTEPGEPGIPRLPCNKKYQLKGAQWKNQRLTALKDSLPLEITTESVKILGIWEPQIGVTDEAIILLISCHLYNCHKILKMLSSMT